MFLAHSVGKLREEDEELFGESFTSLKSGRKVEKQHYFHISAVYLARADAFNERRFIQKHIIVNQSTCFSSVAASAIVAMQRKPHDLGLAY